MSEVATMTDNQHNDMDPRIIPDSEAHKLPEPTRSDTWGDLRTMAHYLKNAMWLDHLDAEQAEYLASACRFALTELTRRRTAIKAESALGVEADDDDE